MAARASHRLSQIRGVPVAAESWFGGQVSAQICRHHRRRLERLGWERALAPPTGGWADGDSQVRAGNSVEVLIDGAEALPRIADELTEARSHVHMTGWYFSPDFALKRDGEHLVLRNLLAELAERLDVRMLAWAGAPLAAVSPFTRAGQGDARPTDAAHADRLQARCEGTAASLSPREDDRDRRPRCFRRRDRSDVGVRRPLRLERARCAGGRRLARRRRSNRGPGGGRCRRALPHALA